jgi:hypothetical protein
MKRINVEFNGAEYTFRTNESGSYLFEGVSENRQISCESGFDSLSRMKRAIKEHLRAQRPEWALDNEPEYRVAMPRVKYSPSQHDTWKP